MTPASNRRSPMNGKLIDIFLSFFLRIHLRRKLWWGREVKRDILVRSDGRSETDASRASKSCLGGKILSKYGLSTFGSPISTTLMAPLSLVLFILIQLACNWPAFYDADCWWASGSTDDLYSSLPAQRRCPDPPRYRKSLKICAGDTFFSNSLPFY